MSVFYDADNAPPLEEVGLIEGTSGETQNKFGDTNVKVYVRMDDTGIYGELTVGILRYTGNVVKWTNDHPPEAVVGLPVRTMVMSFLPGGNILDEAFKGGNAMFSATSTYGPGSTSEWHVHNSDTSCTVTSGDVELEVVGSIRNIKLGGVDFSKNNIADTTYANTSLALRKLAESSPMVKAMINNAPLNKTPYPDGQIGITSTGRLVTKVSLKAGQMVSVPSGMTHRFGSKNGGEENHKYLICDISPIGEDLLGKPAYLDSIALERILPVLIQR